MAELNRRLQSRKGRPRNSSFTAADERDESETRSLNTSLERSLSPKFLKAKQQAVETAQTAPRLTKPLSIKLKQKILPAAISRLNDQYPTFQVQLESFRCFQSPAISQPKKEPKILYPPLIGKIAKYTKLRYSNTDHHSLAPSPKQEISLAEDPNLATRCRSTIRIDASRSKSAILSDLLNTTLAASSMAKVVKLKEREHNTLLKMNFRSNLRPILKPKSKSKAAETTTDQSLPLTITLKKRVQISNKVEHFT